MPSCYTFQFTIWCSHEHRLLYHEQRNQHRYNGYNITQFLDSPKEYHSSHTERIKLLLRQCWSNHMASLVHSELKYDRVTGMIRYARTQIIAILLNWPFWTESAILSYKSMSHEFGPYVGHVLVMRFLLQIIYLSVFVQCWRYHKIIHGISPLVKYWCFEDYGQ